MRVRDESKVEAIFKATLTLVKERGLAGVTMSDISKAAAIGTGTLYIYFKNKDELIRALFQVCRQQSAQHYFANINPADPFTTRMQQVFTNIMHYKMAAFEVSAFLEQSYHSPYVCMTDLNKKQKALQPLLVLLREGIAAGQIKDHDEELLVSYLFGIANEMVKRAYFANKKLVPQTVQQIYQLFWDGIRRQ